MTINFDVERLLFGDLTQQRLLQFIWVIEARIIRIAYARYLKKLDTPLMASEVVEALWIRLRNRREKGLPSLGSLNSWRLCCTITRRTVLREIERLDAQKRSGETKETHYGMDVEFLPNESVNSSLREIECNEELERFIVRLTHRQKQIVLLRHQEYSTAEISNLLGIAYRNVERQCDRIAEKGQIYFGQLFDHSQLATRNSQLATRNSQLATRNSQLARKARKTAIQSQCGKIFLRISAVSLAIFRI